jgi:hypothetical protein
MQFNAIGTYGNHTTNFQYIDSKYKEKGYIRPKIIFWNVNGSTTDFPVSVDDNNTCMVSGASPSILKAIINSKEFSSYSIMRDTLDDERYSQIKI